MRYFDASVVAPLILPEPLSAKVERFVRELEAEDLAISHWTRVEIASLLAREVRMGKLDQTGAAKADSQVNAIIAETFALLEPRTDDFELAHRFLLTPPMSLRAGDALHLAVASNHRAEAIYTLDKTMLKAGRAFGLPMETGIRSVGQ